MKFFRKAVRVLAAALAAATAAVGVCVQASATELIETQAQNDLFRLYMVTDPETPEAGQEITLKIMADTYGSTSIGALKYRIEFNLNNYDYVPDTNAAFNPLVDDTRANIDGYILYNYDGGAKQISGQNQEIISFTFNVKNPTGYFSFGTSDRLVRDSGGNVITTQGSWLNYTFEECKHEEYIIQTTKEPTCTQPGIASYICSKCRVSFNSREIPATGHDWDRTKATYVSAPTCTTGGTMSLPCKNKNCTATLTEQVPALGHSWGAWTVTKIANAYQEGEETRTCTRCNVKETRTIPRNSAITTTAPASTSATTNQISVLPTQLLDLENGVILQFRAGTVDSSTTLEVKKSEQTTTSAKFDITLVRTYRDGTKVTVQPTDTLYITIYIPAGMNGSNYYVYRVEENGGYTDMGATYSGSAVNFRTGHLSEYIVSSVRLTETDPMGTTGATAANPPSTPATTPTPATQPTATSPSAVQFETTTAVPPPPPPPTTPPASSSNDTTDPPDVVWNGTTTAPPVTAGTGSTSGSVGNAGNTGNGYSDDKSQDKNVSTGILAISIPLIAAAVGIFVAKKR